MAFKGSPLSSSLDSTSLSLLITKGSVMMVPLLTMLSRRLGLRFARDLLEKVAHLLQTLEIRRKILEVNHLAVETRTSLF